MTLPPSSYSNLFQVAYVTRDIDAAVKLLTRLYGVTDFNVGEYTLNLSHPPGKTVLKGALTWVDDHEIEVIEPVEDPAEIFGPALPVAPAVLAFNHFCMRITGTEADWDAFRATIPDEKVMMAGSREGMRFIYTDERETIGHYLEYIWTSSEFLAANPHRIPPSQRPK